MYKAYNVLYIASTKPRCERVSVNMQLVNVVRERTHLADVITFAFCPADIWTAFSFTRCDDQSN